MSDIHIERSHTLGLARARQLAQRWSEDAAQKLGLTFTLIPGDASDRFEFGRSGVSGALIVEPDLFTLDAKLGLLIRPFRSQIEAEIESQLDALLASGGQPSN